MDNELDITKLKYVLYARKSTDDPQRQIRSIPDQIAECMQLADRLELRVLKTIQEKKSAKKPNQRPQFRQMLREIKSGKYDAVLAWNPDRLSRNMLEAGELIDLIDENIIKDFKFVTHPFERSANGVMLLGMSFVLSKQYSDDLSQKVTRGVRRSLAEGKTPAFKHGYRRDDDNGLQLPHSKNFELIRIAWQKRLSGVSLEDTAKYLNTNGYERIIKSTGHKVIMTKQILSNIFKDTFYFGRLHQKDQDIDLFSIYDFQPACTEIEFYKVQKLSGNRILPYQKKRAIYCPLKMMVTCKFCGNHMYAGAVTGGSNKKYLTYRCDNEFCSRKKKSIRGHIIFDFIYDFLKNGFGFTEKDYQNYLSVMKQNVGKKHDELDKEIHSKEAKIKILEREIADISLKVLDLDKDSIIRKTNEGRVEADQAEMEKLKTEVTLSKTQRANPEQQILTLENFLNLSKNSATTVQLGNEIVKDAICRLLFLNFTVDEEKVTSYQAKPPFDTLIKTHKILSSRGERT